MFVIYKNEYCFEDLIGYFLIDRNGLFIDELYLVFFENDMYFYI